MHSAAPDDGLPLIMQSSLTIYFLKMQQQQFWMVILITKAQGRVVTHHLVIPYLSSPSTDGA